MCTERGALVEDPMMLHIIYIYTQLLLVIIPCDNTYRALPYSSNYIMPRLLVNFGWVDGLQMFKKAYLLNYILKLDAM